MNQCHLLAIFTPQKKKLLRSTEGELQGQYEQLCGHTFKYEARCEDPTMIREAMIY